MSGIFSSMNTATKGLMAQQTALHTTGHNISNVNTEGFTRQRVDMQADRAFSLAGVGQLGTGVRMQGVVRMINDHVSKNIRQENSTLNRFQEKSDVIDQLEIIFNEPSDTGLSFNISEMFNAFQNLSENPENVNFKTVAVEKLKTLTDTMNHMAGQIERLEGETHDSIDKNVLDFNSTVESLNQLNKQIFNISIKGQVPNDLLDQRDMMLKDLTAIADVDLSFDNHGRVGISMGEGQANKNNVLSPEGKQQFLGYGREVDAKGNAEIKLFEEAYDADNDVDNTNYKGSGSVVKIKNGKLLGNSDAIKDIKESAKSLDEMALTMANGMNKIHRAGNAATGQAEIDIFDISDKENLAKNIKVNKAITDDNEKLQAGKTKDDDGLIEGDGSLALELAGLRNQKLDKNGDISTDSKGNTIGGSYRDMVIKIGISKQHSDNMVKNQEVLSNQLEMRRESVSGVSLDDEVSNVIKFQKAYEANAKVISVLTDMLDVLINRTGV